MEHKFADIPFGSLEGTNIHVISIIILLIGCYSILRQNDGDRLSILILITAVIPLHQKIYFGGIYLSITRILILVCLIRSLCSGGRTNWQVNIFDKIVFAWAITRALTYGLLWESTTALVSRIGLGIDLLGIYTCTRILIRKWRDFENVLKTISIACVTIAIAMLLERITGTNIFDFLLDYSGQQIWRGESIRCQGPFGHPILAGTFGAACFPLLVALKYSSENMKRVALAGCTGCLMIVWLSASSGPVIACVLGFLTICFWPARFLRKKIFFLLMAIMALISAITSDPVWTLVVRLKIFKESAAWHRGLLLSEFISRVEEWWLIGTRYTDHWGHFSFDVSNWIVRLGVDGGFITVGLFLSIIILCYFRLSYVITVNENDRNKCLYAWGLVAALFVHVFSFFGVSYWDQNLMIWGIFLGMVCWVKESEPYEKIKKRATATI